MSKKEYKARVKQFKKMTWEGLKEENPLDGSLKEISTGSENRILGSDDFQLGKEPEEKIEYHVYKNEQKKDSSRKKSKKRRIYKKRRYMPENTADEKRSGDRAYDPATEFWHQNDVEKRGFTYLRQNADDTEKDPQDTAVARRDVKTAEIPMAKDLFHRSLPKKRNTGGSFDKETPDQASGRRRLLHEEDAGIRPKKKKRKMYQRAVTGMQAAGGALVTYSAEQADDNAAVDSVEAGYRAAETGLSAVRRVSYSGKSRPGQRRRTEKSTRAAQMVYRERKQTAQMDVGQRHVSQGKFARDTRKRIYRKRYRKIYRDAGMGRTVSGNVIALFRDTKKSALPKKIVGAILGKQKIYLIVGVLVLGMLLLVSVFASTGAIFQAVGGVVASTTYPSEDADIYAAEQAYLELEQDLNRQINRMEATHPGYDEYRYNVDEISHNPYQLTSFLSAKYGNFTYPDIESVLSDLFQEQYTLTVQTTYETVTETRTVQVGESLGTVVTSGYCNCVLCCGIWAGGNTASGVPPTSGHTIAVDARDPIVPMGTKVVMNGVEYTVEDTGNFNRYGVDFDVYYDSHAEALAHGHQSVEAYLSDSNGSNSVEVTETTTKKILNITLVNEGFGTVAGNNLSRDQRQMYDLYNYTLGNRSDLFGSYSTASDDYTSFTPSAEAMSDERFANMIYEAEKYLGVPYVWGGYSPAGFDCSGFVSYVINHCGNGWDVGRLTANGLKDACAPVALADARPGDLIFFQGTYQTSGASHVGIIVGDGMMIHCGSPVQYTSYETSYWQNHFLSVGRLP